jgi:hypothetical protein
MPPKLSYGLNLPSKTAAQPGGQKRKKGIFDADSDDEQANDGSNGAEEITTVGGVDGGAIQPKKNASGGLPTKKKTLGGASKPNVKPLNKNSIFADDDEDEGDERGSELKLGMNPAKGSASSGRPEYTNLSALHSSKKHAQEAEELDPSIYSYDAIYDGLHAKPKESETAKAREGPRYMTSLLHSAEVRKRDQLRARDRMLAKEREAEGDEFADKEKFVTSAYKAQQEELRKIEEEDAQKEKEEEERRRKNAGAGMVDFYRDVLSRGEQRHEETLKTAEATAQKVKTGEIPEVGAAASKEKSEAQVAAELNASGAHIAVNDEGQVVDKRQLLSAGLNVAPKPKPPPSAAASRADTRPAAAKPRFDSGQHAARAGQRARQTEMIATQLEDQSRKEEEAEEARQKEIAERSRSHRTEKDVSGAKERYLARKREREEAAKGGS